MKSIYIKTILAFLLSVCMLFTVGCSNSNVSSGKSENKETSSDSNLKVESYEKDGVIYVGDNTKVSAETTVKNFGDFKSQSDDEASTLRKEILEAKDTIKSKGTTWYISNDGDDQNEGNSPQKPWKTLNALSVNAYKIAEGDAVLFRRGDIFRGYITATSGVSYGAYGEGDKPCIYGCLKNYAEEVWRPTSEENIWAMIVSTNDVGMIIFNHGEAYGNKKIENVFECDEDYEFFYDQENGMLYLYCSKGDPSRVFYDIEFLSNKTLLYVKDNSENIYIENLCLKYTGGHCISLGKPVKGITIKNCEIGWIGGAIFRNKTERYGNGIQFYGQCSDSVIDHCWVYQCYDAGLTHQYSGSGETKHSAENLTYTNNLVEFCSYSFEYFWGWSENGTQKDIPEVKMKNIVIENNIMRFSGYGLGKNRPNSWNVGHLVTWNSYINPHENFTVKNNIFDTSLLNLINMQTFYSENPTMEGNTYIQKNGGKIGVNSTNKNTEGGVIEPNESAISLFDKNGKLIITQ